MALRLPSVLTLSLSGVLAFLGLWWYTSRKKGLTDEDDGQDKMASDQEQQLSSTNGDALVVLGRNICSTGTDDDQHVDQRRLLVERELIDNRGYSEATAAGLGVVPLCAPQPGVRALTECLSGAMDTVTGSTGSSAERYPKTSPKSQGQGRPAKNIALNRDHQPLCAELATSVCVRGHGRSGVSDGMSQALESAPNRASTGESTGQVREDPEGEVDRDKMFMHFEELRPQMDLAEDLLSKEDLPVLSLVVEPVYGSSGQSDTDLTFPSHISISQVTCSREPVDDQRSLQKTDQLEECELSQGDALEIKQLASGLITDVVTAAVNQVLQEKALLDCIVTSVHSRGLWSDTFCVDDSVTKSQMTHLLSRDQCTTTGGGNVTSSPVVLEDVKRDYIETAETQQIELPDEGSGSGPYAESSSGEDLSPAVSPQSPGGPAECLGSSSVAFTHDHRTEEGASSGSGVNSRDTTHSFCDDSDSASPISQLLNTDQPNEKYDHNVCSSQIWEIEVPKHLVGRLIGKQGRYVSQLKEMSGAKVFITTLPYTQDVQICHIEGSEEQVACALELIRKKFKDLDVTNCYVQPALASLPSPPVTSWLMLPHRLTVEVTVVLVASGNYVFLQQHTHPTFHALYSLDQQMTLCYSHPGCPALPPPVEVGVICAAQMPEGAWWRAQVISYHGDSREVELRYVDYGGYERVNVDALRQIRSDFVSLPFQGSEVILENIAPLPGEEEFSAGAKCALEEMTHGLSVLAQVTNCHHSGIPLVQIWRREGQQLVSVNRALVDNGLCSWVDG
ncbi:hypothetical protein DPEC_G00231290 [Dallia pectoralis]|uniref:Uncharacterized protein n=1 Tax=Dallia pectoralis TaxID=75939 RepID=A0ACC2FWU4_DALPE|nr:hypothetical protein DPEC_G00231290 [Dallia pectoralis]